MHSSSESSRVTPWRVLSYGGRFVLLILGWLGLSVQVAAILALVVLGADAFGWKPFLPSDPSERLLWVAVFGAVTGLVQQVDAHLFRRNR